MRSRKTYLKGHKVRLKITGDDAWFEGVCIGAVEELGRIKYELLMGEEGQENTFLLDAELVEWVQYVVEELDGKELRLIQ